MKKILLIILIFSVVAALFCYFYSGRRASSSTLPPAQEKSKPVVEQSAQSAVHAEVEPIVEPAPEPVPMSIGGFHLGMTLDEACDLINSKYAEIFPNPIVAFDECANQAVLEGTLRIPFRYRYPYVKGQEPWKSFPVQPVKIDTKDARRMLIEENLDIRKGMQRHILTFDKCFVANGKLYTERYNPVYRADGTRLDNDNASAQFQAGPDGIITNIYFSQEIAEKLLETKDLTDDQFALKLANDFQIAELSIENRWNQSGERVDAWTYNGEDGAKLVILPGREILLETVR